jgi:hypothetical protein
MVKRSTISTSVLAPMPCPCTCMSLYISVMSFNVSASGQSHRSSCTDHQDSAEIHIHISEARVQCPGQIVGVGLIPPRDIGRDSLSSSADSAAFLGYSSRSKVAFGLNLHQLRVRREIKYEKYLVKGLR